MVVDYIEPRDRLVRAGSSGSSRSARSCRTPACRSPRAPTTPPRPRPPSARAVRDAELVEDIKVAHKANLGVYGARKIHAELNREGIAGRPLHRGAADEGRGSARDPAGEDPQDHRRRRRGDRAARGPGQAEVRRHRTEPAVGGRPDLRPHARRLDLRRVRPRRLLPDGRRLAGVDLAAHRPGPGRPRHGPVGPAARRPRRHRADPSQRPRSPVSSDSLHRAARRSRGRRVRRLPGRLATTTRWPRR